MKRIEVLGTGCAKCKKLYEATEEALKVLGIEAELVKVEDIQKIMGYGLLMTPGLVVDGVVKSFGKVPSFDELKTLLS